MMMNTRYPEQEMDDRHLRSSMVAAQRKREKGNWIAAVNIYRDLIDERPDFTEPYCELARIYLEHDRIDEARGMVEAALAKNPKDPECSFLMGLVSYILGNFDRALDSYKKVEETSGLDPSLRINIALVFEARGEYKDAIMYLEPVLNEPSVNWKVFEVLSDLYLSTRNIARAAEVLEMGVKKFPGQGNLHFLLGSAYFQVRNYSRAAQHLSNAQTNLPSNPTLQEQLGISLVKVGQLERGIKMLRQIFAEEPWNLDVGLALAEGYRLADQPKSAKDVLEQLVSRNPENRRLKDELARVRQILAHPEDMLN